MINLNNETYGQFETFGAGITFDSQSTQPSSASQSHLLSALQKNCAPTNLSLAFVCSSEVGSAKPYCGSSIQGTVIQNAAAQSGKMVSNAVLSVQAGFENNAASACLAEQFQSAYAGTYASTSSKAAAVKAGRALLIASLTVAALTLAHV